MFPENLNVSGGKVEGNIEIHQNSLSPRDQSLSDLLYSKNQAKANFKKRAEIAATTSQRPPLITCNSGQHFTGNSELFPVLRYIVCNVARSWHLAGNSFIVRCHVTMN